MESFYIYKEEEIFNGFSIDCVLLSFHKGKIRVLLRKTGYKDYWALLGGFMLKNEDADQAALRILEDYTGLNKVYLRQFQLFSDFERTNEAKTMVDEGVISKLFLDRFITMGYYALVKYDDVKISKSSKSKLKWFDILEKPQLYADHGKIIDTAINIIRGMLPIIPVGHALLPEKFTMSELRKIYEIILNTTFDRRNFQRKVLSEGNIVQLDEKKGNGEYNSASLFTFKEGVLNSLKNNETGIIV